MPTRPSSQASARMMRSSACADEYLAMILFSTKSRADRLFGLPQAARPRLVFEETHAPVCIKDILKPRYMAIMHCVWSGQAPGYGTL